MAKELTKSDCLKCWQMLIAPKIGLKMSKLQPNFTVHSTYYYYYVHGLEILARINVHFTVVVKTQELPQQSTNTTEKLKSTNSTSIWSV